MERRRLGFFSGFPRRRFPRRVAERLAGELAGRDSLVFISAWPEDFSRNDQDAAGMYGMFLEYGMDFGERHVIDSRTEADQAAKWTREASCVFLMGGHPGQQRGLLREKGLEQAVRGCAGMVLGVSAGAINMAARSLDTKESPVPYEGLGLAGITVKPHFSPEDRQVLSSLLEISAELPICAMEDESAIFVSGDRASHVGRIHWVDKGEIRPFSPALLGLAKKK